MERDAMKPNTTHYPPSVLSECVCVYFLFYNVVYPKHELSSRAAFIWCSVCAVQHHARALTLEPNEPTPNFHPTPHTHTLTYTTDRECVFFAIAPARSPQACTYFTYCFIFVRLPHTFAAQT
jgi:hypothetical protein